MAALIDRRLRLRIPFVMIWDFFGNDPITSSPVERLLSYLTNVTWLRAAVCSHDPGMALFVGEPEDVADRSFGRLLPNGPGWPSGCFSSLVISYRSIPDNTRTGRPCGRSWGTVRSP